MRKLISTALAGAFISSVVLISAVPAFANHEHHHKKHHESHEYYEEEHHEKREHHRKKQHHHKAKQHHKGHGHVARCKARYHSYNAHTDTFGGHDGRRHKCRL